MNHSIGKRRETEERSSVIIILIIKETGKQVLLLKDLRFIIKSSQININILMKDRETELMKDRVFERDRAMRERERIKQVDFSNS